MQDMRARAVVPTNIGLKPADAELLERLRTSSGRTKGEIMSLALRLYASTTGKVKLPRQAELELEAAE